jgi:hypothetical protein
MTVQDLDWPAEPALEIDVEACNKIIASIKNVLIEKNKRYGNSALAPINVFYKGNATDSICIRLDDKLSRIKNSSELRKNDLYDLLGYCILYLISVDKDDSKTFEQKVDLILEIVKTNYINNNFHEKKYLGCKTFEFDGFLKGERGNNVIDSLNGVCSDIKNHLIIHNHIVIRLINFLIVYFIQIGVTDFSDLID